MYFFLAGYISFLIILLIDMEFPLELIAGSVFFAGSLFVFLVINLTGDTINKTKKADEERKKIQAQLHRAQKMESVGRLAGGVAHDFNNILTVILGYSELALMKNVTDTTLREQLESIYGAGKKAAGLVRQLLAFSRQQVLEMKPVNINTIVNNVCNMLVRLIGEDVELKLNLAESIKNINADSGQIEQVLLNLAINSRDAMVCGGKLFIDTADVLLDEEFCIRHPDVTPGAYVMLAITDTGIGMPEELLENIFDPFFTTKEQGKGTGLGLATVHGIIKQHSGHIFVYSKVEQGTTCRIYFPAVTDALEEAIIEKETALIAPVSPKTILVVDDEPVIRDLIIDTLAPLGYNCLEAACGDEALKIAQDLREEVDILLTDVVMPGMNGKDLADIFVNEHPKTKVLFMSGYTDNIIVHHGVLEPQYNFLEKPLTPSRLIKKINQLLGT